VNFLFKIALAHIEAAFLSNWKTTLCGVVVAVLGVAPKLTPLFQGKSIDQVDWSTAGSLLAGAIGLVLAKDFSLTSIIFSAPKAEPVKK
jgi:hypothetical protein